MQKFLSEADCKWLEETFARFDLKMEKECERLGDKIPYIPKNGHYEEDLGERDYRLVDQWVLGRDPVADVSRHREGNIPQES